MSPSFVGEIMMFAGSFAPQGWAFCDGSLMSIAQDEALFVLLGTTYGGDGQSTFGLPDLRGRMPVHQGSNGFSNYPPGQNGGTEQVTLTTNQLPSHTHPFNATSNNGNSKQPGGGTIPAGVSGTNTNVYSTAASDSTMRANILANAGGSQPHNNLQPTLAISFCIALFGVFPSQN